MHENEISEKIIGAAIEVHRILCVERNIDPFTYLLNMYTYLLDFSSLSL